MKQVRKIFASILGLTSICLLAGGVACNNPTENNADNKAPVWTMETVFAKAQDLGYTGTLEEFQNSIKGKDGVGIADIYADETGAIVVVLTDESQTKFVLDVGGACAHSWEEAYVLEEATCQNGAKKLYTCSDCGLSQYVEEETTAGHNFEHGECLSCGELKYSEGLEFELNADGESYKLVGLGDCRDESLVIPATYQDLPVTEMEQYLLWDCDFVKSLVLSDTITNAFVYCPNVEYVKIGDSVEYVAFLTRVDGLNTYIKEISVSENNPYYTTIDGNLYSKDGSKLVKYANGKNDFYFNIPNTVKEIGADAFCNASALTQVNIPETVTKIGEYAFYACSSLKSAKIPASIENMGMGQGVFSNCLSLVEVELNGLLDADYAMETESPYVASFANCSALTKVSFGANMKAIPMEMFADCTSLIYISISEGITYIGQEAFSGCTALTNVVIPDSVTEIAASAFENCKSLRSVTVPENVTALGGSAFSGCISLEEAYVGDSVKRIYDYTFEGCTALKKVVIGDGVTQLDKNAFSECYQQIEYLEIGDALSELTVVFRSLKTIVLGSSITKIGDNVFRWCEDLTDVYFKGTKEEWDALTIGNNNACLDKAQIYYYSETQPTEEGNFWHDDVAGDGVFIW